MSWVCSRQTAGATVSEVPGDKPGLAHMRQRGSPAGRWLFLLLHSPLQAQEPSASRSYQSPGEERRASSIHWDVSETEHTTRYRHAALGEMQNSVQCLEPTKKNTHFYIQKHYKQIKHQVI